MVPSGGATVKIPSDTTGNRSRDRPTSSAAQRLNQYATPGPYIILYYITLHYIILYYIILYYIIL